MNKDAFYIKGLGGEKSLEGELVVMGAKNSILPLLASTIVVRGNVSFANVPDIEDVHRMTEILNNLGATTSNLTGSELKVDTENVHKTQLDIELSKKMRASVILTGPMLSRFGEVKFPHPGGCVIGARPIDIFTEGFQKMGATFSEDETFYTFKVSGSKLKATNIFLKSPSVTATETFLIAAVGADGTTRIENAAMEPEIVDLAVFLRSCGATITGDGTPTITIVGGKDLVSNSTPYNVMPDRIEAGSFLILAAVTAKNCKISNIDPSHIRSVLELLTGSGVPIRVTENSVYIENNTEPSSSFKSFDIKTHEYPGFPTDIQAPAMIFLSQCSGESLVFETIFEGRLNYTEDLVRMGADIKMWDTHRATIKGPTHLKGRELEGPDIRAGLAYVIAGLVANGDSIIRNAYFIDRGYMSIEKRLSALGADIKRKSYSI